MRTLLLVVGLLAGAPAGAAAQAATVTGITVTHVGTYTGETTSTPAQSGQHSPTGTVGTGTDWHFVSDSPDVLGNIGTEFGIEFHIDGSTPGAAATLYAVFNFPPQGMRNPNTGDLTHSAKIAFPNLKVGAVAVIGYGFDNAWEIVPGEWTEQIWYQDRMLTERKFTVSKAD
jgi:Domain of unknown function (DUF3859)